MKSTKNLNKLEKLVAGKSGWLEKAKKREKNEVWLDRSFKIALNVLRSLRDQNMSQKELAEKMGVTPQHINKIVKGQENLSLETISKLETALGIELISIPSIKTPATKKHHHSLSVQGTRNKKSKPASA
jgi:ribosome-binding protein aMBF1 (putative translation factor)